jgi:hypothetical protein
MESNFGSLGVLLIEAIMLCSASVGGPLCF